MLGKVVADRQALHTLAAGQLVELVQLQPQAFRHRAIELLGADQRAAETADGPLQGEGEDLCAFAGEARCLAHHHQLVAHGQVVLQGLAEVGDLARALVEDDGLVEKVAFEVVADRLDFRAEQLQQLQAGLHRELQLVQLDQALVQLACGLAEVGLGQVVQPVFDIARSDVAEAQAFLRRGGDAQQLLGTRIVHGRMRCSTIWAVRWTVVPVLGAGFFQTLAVST